MVGDEKGQTEAKEMLSVPGTLSNVSTYSARGNVEGFKGLMKESKSKNTIRRTKIDLKRVKAMEVV